MKSIKKLGTAVVLAAVLAGGVGTANLEAAKKKSTSSTTDALAATCAYLWSVMTYEYVTPTVYLYAASLYNYYGCASL